MLSTDFIIPCGGLDGGNVSDGGPVVLPLDLWSHKESAVTFKVEDLHGGLFKALPKRFADLLDIASYVYAADQATGRGRKDVDTFGQRWRRKLDFAIPVRDAKFWGSAETVALLQSTLSFLSDDYFSFKFERGDSLPAMQDYFELDTAGGKQKVERVVLFSGGLDSLAGAVEESVVSKRRVILVTHRPTSKLNTIQRNLESLLAAKAGAFAPMHLHVRAWKDSDLNKDYTQRTRSFLYAAVGATVARMLGLDELRFYENGVVSMNLPVSAQVVGSRATRTTHPRVLADFSKLMGAVADKPFHVLNDFMGETKGEIISRIVRAGCGDLIGASVSCAHTFSMSTEHPHCGTCSQCIDRRIGVCAADAEQYDSPERYASDVFVGPRPSEEDRMMVASYVERANEVAKLKTAADLVVKFPEAARAFGFLPGTHDAVAARILDMHRRHGAEVNRALEKALKLHAKAVRERTLLPDCLLRLVYDTGKAGAAPQPEGKAHASQAARLEKDPNEFRLAKDLGWWRLVFKGDPAVVPDNRAVVLLNCLLKNPPYEPVHATELEVRALGAPVVDGEVKGVVQEATGAALNSGDNTVLRRKLRELKAAREDESLPESERTKAAEEMEELLEASMAAKPKNGEAARAAERVRKALSRFINDLKTAKDSHGGAHPVLCPFAQHLEDCVYLPSVGGKKRAGAVGRAGCFTYMPPDGVRWKD
jgi:7-cyano-7-deazaguanine synthase in queuosine biosynthesis